MEPIIRADGGWHHRRVRACYSPGASPQVRGQGCVASSVCDRGTPRAEGCQPSPWCLDGLARRTRGTASTSGASPMRVHTSIVHARRPHARAHGRAHPLLRPNDPLRLSLLTHRTLTLTDLSAVYLRTDQDAALSSAVEAAKRPRPRLAASCATSQATSPSLVPASTPTSYSAF